MGVVARPLTASPHRTAGSGARRPVASPPPLTSWSIGETRPLPHNPVRQPRPVFFPREIGRHRVPKPANACIGEESLGTATGGDEDLTRAGAVILLRHEQHHHAEVFRRIARFP